MSSSHKEKCLGTEIHLHGCLVLKRRPSVHSLEGLDTDKDVDDWLFVKYPGKWGAGEWSQREEEKEGNGIWNPTR